MTELKIFTGGSGLLGLEMQKLYPNDLFPTSSLLDITDTTTIDNYIKSIKNKNKISSLIHMAAFTSPPKIDKNPIKALDTNIIGTTNIVKACIKYNIRLVYISTDYVFSGEKGMYSETDDVYPVNKYAWSKLGGECSVRLYDKATIIRLSFGPDKFPYDGAFVDQFTSREPVSKISKKIQNIINSNYLGIIHIGSQKRSVYEYAKSLNSNKDIKKMYRKDVDFYIPIDTSLDIYLYESLYSSVEE